jgi:hypothetical protein
VIRGADRRRIHGGLGYTKQASNDERRRRCARTSRLIAKLRGHGLVAKVRGVRLYRVTPYGQRVLRRAHRPRQRVPGCLPRRLTARTDTSPDRANHRPEVSTPLPRLASLARDRWPLRGQPRQVLCDVYVSPMPDALCARYGDLVSGTYDCVDRIVLNAYFSMGHSPGGFRTWWRRLHGSDDDLDNTHLMRMAGRFARRVRGWAKANHVPVIDTKAGERKHRIAEEYLATHQVGVGVFLVLVARAPTTVWKVTRSRSGVIVNLERKTEYVNHYSFHIRDPVWGTSRSRCPGTLRSAPKSSSTATSTSPARRERPASASSKRATASPR